MHMSEADGRGAWSRLPLDSFPRFRRADIDAMLLLELQKGTAQVQAASRPDAELSPTFAD